MVVEQDPPIYAIQLLPQASASFKTETPCKVENNNGDDDPEYAQYKAQLVIQKFSKFSKLGRSIGCGTLDLLRMLSVEETSSNAMFFDTRKPF